MAGESKVYRARAVTERALAEELRTIPGGASEAVAAELRAKAFDRMADAEERS